MDKHCFLVGQKDSLFKQLVASLLVDLADDLNLHVNKTEEFDGLMDEIKEIRPDMILLEDASPFSEDSLTIRLLVNIPDLPVIVISEDSNLLHIVRRDTRLLSSSKDLIETINLVMV